MSNPHKTIGIIVPLYNVAKHLERCLDSILAQTHRHFYAVLVNDGSTDESLEIAKNYVAKDSRLILFDKPNAGQSSARNVGIEYFAGKYTSLRTKPLQDSALHSSVYYDSYSRSSFGGNYTH